MSFESKTLQLIERYQRIIEADELPPGASPEDMGGDVQDVTQPEPTQGQPAPLTSEGELEYINALVNAALFKPNTEEANTLLQFQRSLTEKDSTADPRIIGDTVKVMVQPKESSPNSENGQELSSDLDAIA